jgi:hypothetical protein
MTEELQNIGGWLLTAECELGSVEAMCWKVDDREFRGICAGAPQAKKGDF